MGGRERMHKGALGIAVLGLTVGCPGPTGDGTEGADGMLTDDPSTSATAPTGGTSGGPGSGDVVDGSGTTSPGTDSADTQGGRVPGDCLSLLEQKPDSPDGIYTLNVGGDPNGRTFDAYCDMTIDGGGWTLVGRSVAGDWGESFPFGWRQATGDVDNDGVPYSIDALDVELEFSQVLMGSYTRGKTWGADVYRVEVPEHFVALYGQVPHPILTTTVSGDCSPKQGPHHMRHIGWTEASGYFSVRQYSDVGIDGLEAAGWDTDHSDCDGGGNLHEGPGMIMVR